MTAGPFVLAADIGGTKISTGVVGPDGFVLGEVITAPTPARRGPDAVLQKTVELLHAVVDRSDWSPEAVAIASAGVIDSDRGIVLAATGQLPGWANTPVAERISDLLSLPVRVLGDGHAFAIGTTLDGVAALSGVSGASTVLVLAAGTGVAGSYLIDGVPQTGSHRAAGHVGHLAVPEAVGAVCDCGRVGHLEAVAGGAGLIRRYHLAGGDAAVINGRDLLRVSTTDRRAAEAIRNAGAALGTAAGGLVNTVDPDVVLVAGGLTGLGDHWELALRQAYQRTLMPLLESTPLLIVSGRDWPALRGAAHWSRRTAHAHV